MNTEPRNCRPEDLIPAATAEALLMRGLKEAKEKYGYAEVWSCPVHKSYIVEIRIAQQGRLLIREESFSALLALRNALAGMALTRTEELLE